MSALLIIMILAIQPCFSAEISPFLDPSVQDYVETSYGYMAGRKNYMQDLRDAPGPIAKIKSPVQYVLRRGRGNTGLPCGLRTGLRLPDDSKDGRLPGPDKSEDAGLPCGLRTGLRLPDDSRDGRLPRKSGSRSYSSAEKKKLLAGLNSFSAEEVKNLEAEGAVENTPAGRVRFAGAPGSMASAVPPVGSSDCGYLYAGTPASGFKTEIHLSLKIPAGVHPRRFLGMVLRKMNKEAGFVWKKTVELSFQHLADSGPASTPALAVTVSGNVPADRVSKLFEYPFVTRIK